MQKRLLFHFEMLLAVFAIICASLFAVYVRLPREPPFAQTELEPLEDYIDIDNGFERRVLRFPCGPEDDIMCEGFLFLPLASGPKPPVLIMAPGMGAQTDFKYNAIAPRFASSGIASFLFDYRGFGGSDGDIRNYISPHRHLQDWHSAISFVSDNLGDVVDTENIALWGTSYSGGHVLVVASQLANDTRKRVRGVVSQIPYLDSRKSGNSLSIATKLRLALLGVEDAFCEVSGLCERRYVQVIGTPDDTCFVVTNQKSKEEILSKRKSGRGGWQNKCPAIVALESTMYRPVKFVGMVNAPILYMAGGQDKICPLSAVKNAIEQTAHSDLWVGEDLDHFDFYDGEGLDRAMDVQIPWLRKCFK